MWQLSVLPGTLLKAISLLVMVTAVVLLASYIVSALF